MQLCYSRAFAPRVCLRSRLPRVEDGDPYGLKVAHIPGYNRHAMDERCGRDQSIAV